MADFTALEEAIGADMAIDKLTEENERLQKLMSECPECRLQVKIDRLIPNPDNKTIDELARGGDAVLEGAIDHLAEGVEIICVAIQAIADGHTPERELSGDCARTIAIEAIEKFKARGVAIKPMSG